LQPSGVRIPFTPPAAECAIVNVRDRNPIGRLCNGWYDHQMPPIVNSSADPALDGLNGPGVCGKGTPLGGIQDRCGYGQRLPILVISPFARPNFVGSTIDQSSVLKFIEDNRLGGQRTGTSSFDNIAGSMENMFKFGQPTAAPLIMNARGQVVSR
jgi:phospholipase C